MSELTHLSLFSGIGGLDLAAEWAGFTTVGQCEFAKFPTKVLEKHWHDVPRWRDIHDLSADEFYRRTGRKSVTLISGGFPCQPHSVAGLRMASGDERDLWPEMRRVISEIRPQWVVGENVRGLLTSEDGRFFRGVLRDLAELGFDVGWGVISAAAVGAIHRRERVAIIAHNSSKRRTRIRTDEVPGVEILQGVEVFGGIAEFGIRSSVYTPKLCRADDGIPDRLDRTKALGNCVVPQQFYSVFASIAKAEELYGSDIY